jgi:heme exporter protein D
MNGVVAGGWEFVWAAYGLTFTAFAIYGALLIKQLRQSRSHDYSND